MNAHRKKNEFTCQQIKFTLDFDQQIVPKSSALPPTPSVHRASTPKLPALPPASPSASYARWDFSKPPRQPAAPKPTPAPLPRTLGARAGNTSNQPPRCTNARRVRPDSSKPPHRPVAPSLMHAPHTPSVRRASTPLQSALPRPSLSARRVFPDTSNHTRQLPARVSVPPVCMCVPLCD